MHGKIAFHFCAVLRYRDTLWEKKLLEMCHGLGIGAQFGGKYFVHDVCVVRMAECAWTHENPKAGDLLTISAQISSAEMKNQNQITTSKQRDPTQRDFGYLFGELGVQVPTISSHRFGIWRCTY